MTISSTVRIAGPYVGSGAATAFPFAFKVFAAAEMQVAKLNTTSNVETILVLNTDYTVTLNGDQNGTPGGTITLPAVLASGYNLTITSDIANLQPTDLTNQGGFYPEVITDALDRATIQIQQLDQNSRAIKIPLSDGVLDMTTPVVSARQGKYLAFDTFGLPVVSSGTGSDSALRTDLANATAVSAGSRLSGFRQTGTGATARTVDAKLKDTVSVKDFGAVGDGVTDDSAAIQAAIITGKQVFFPSGTYLCNVYMGNTILFGEGSILSIIKPYNTAIAAVTIVQSTPYWSSQKEIRNIGFAGIGTRLGVGVAFGITDITAISYASGYTSDNPNNATGTYGFPFIQTAQSVKFYGCRFSNLNKGISWTAGNIGSELYSCSFFNCKYGAYMLDNKGGGSPMQSGCKSFYGGEMNTCDVAVYSNNQLVTNGQINFDSVIFEQNKIAFYFYETNNSASGVNPFVFNNLWIEANGAYFGGTVSVDTYTGSTTTLVKSTTTISAATFWFEGGESSYRISNSFAGDIRVTGQKTNVILDSCVVETTSGYGGGDIVVTYPDTSTVAINNCKTTRGIGVKPGTCVKLLHGLSGSDTINNTPTLSAGRAWTIENPISFASNGYRKYLATSLDFTSSITTTGSYALVGSVVSDGLLFETCNEFTRVNMAANEYVAAPSTAINTTAGFYVTTCCVKLTSGSVSVGVWDLGSNQLYQGQALTELNKWITIGSLGYATGVQALNLYFGGTAYVGNTTWQVSQYQLLRFNTRKEAEDYLYSRCYCQTSPSENVINYLTANATISIANKNIVNNKAAATLTVTLPSAATYPGASFTITNNQAFTVVSASANIVPIAGGAAGTAILAATAGVWATLVSNGTNWAITAS